VAEVASRLEVTTHNLYQWMKKYSVSAPERQAAQGQEAEMRKLKAELKRVTEERDIPKRPPRTLPRRPDRARIYPGA
jgi:transposase